MRQGAILSASITKALADGIDLERGDVSRSRYVRKVFDSYYQAKDAEKQGQERNDDVAVVRERVTTPSSHSQDDTLRPNLSIVNVPPEVISHEST